jgi:CRP-like cAMP-binding protein
MSISPSLPRNLLLKSLPQKSLDLVLKSAEFIHLDIRENIIEPNKPVQFIDFPEVGVMSIVRPMEDGSLVEVAAVGNEGMLGFSIAMGVDFIEELAFCQVEGASWRISSGDFLKIFVSNQEVADLCFRYSMDYSNQISQNMGCVMTHSLEERCARWLLSTHDRCGKDEFTITQEFLASMLGVSRTSVNLAAGMLSKAKLIRYVRGKVTILDRSGLEEVSCTCYLAVRNYGTASRRKHS